MAFFIASLLIYLMYENMGIFGLILSSPIAGWTIAYYAFGRRKKVE